LATPKPKAKQANAPIIAPIAIPVFAPVERSLSDFVTWFDDVLLSAVDFDAAAELVVEEEAAVVLEDVEVAVVVLVDEIDDDETLD